MDFISKLLFGNDENIEKRNIAWNMAGSFIYALMSMLLGSFVIRLTNKNIGGIFFFAFSTLGQQIYTIAYFGVRPTQITDIENKFSFSDYRYLRFLSTGAAIAAGICYTVLFAGTGEEIIIYSLMIIYRALDGFIDCYESEFQRQGRLYMAGKSLAFRTSISLAGFVLSLYLSKNIFISSLIFVFLLCICAYLFALRPLKYFNIIKGKFSKDKLMELALLNSWLFTSTFLDLYIFSSSKYAVNKFMGGEYNSYFSAVFIPTSMINLMAGFVIRPLLTELSLAYENGKFEKFKKYIIKILLMIAVFGFFALTGAFIFGEFFIKITVGGDNLSKYIPLLLIIMLGGLFYAVLNLFYYCLVIMKKQKVIFIIYLIFTFVAYISANFATKLHGLAGASIVYTTIMFLMMLCFALFSMLNLGKE